AGGEGPVDDRILGVRRDEDRLDGNAGDQRLAQHLRPLDDERPLGLPSTAATDEAPQPLDLLMLEGEAGSFVQSHDPAGAPTPAPRRRRDRARPPAGGGEQAAGAVKVMTPPGPQPRLLAGNGTALGLPQEAANKRPAPSKSSPRRRVVHHPARGWRRQL